MHADYSVDASIIIEKHTNHILFSNPGTLLISRRQYYAGGESVCRNKALQKMFIMLGKAEKAGSGVDKIIKGWEKRYWPIPQIELKNRPDKVNLILSIESMLDEEIKKKLQVSFGRDVINLPYEQLITLATALEQGEVSNEMLRPLLNLHRVDITALLKHLCQEGYLISLGIGRGTKYHLSSSNMGSPESNVGSNMGSSESNMGSPNSIHPKKRMSNKELYELICSICEDYVSLDYIAQKVKRNANYLTDKIIKDMLSKGLLERLHPETPKHPDQKYRSVKKTIK